MFFLSSISKNRDNDSECVCKICWIRGFMQATLTIIKMSVYAKTRATLWLDQHVVRVFPFCQAGMIAPDQAGLELGKRHKSAH